MNLPDRITEIDLEGLVDAKGVRYLGKARKQENGKWTVLADVSGCLALVEVTITAEIKA